jgi:hypothetical protein
MTLGFVAALDLLAKQVEFMSSPDEMRRLPAFSMILLDLDRSPERARELFLRLKQDDPSPVYVHILYDYWKLDEVTDPVPPESRGKAREIASAWLAWGARHGYV